LTAFLREAEKMLYTQTEIEAKISGDAILISCQAERNAGDTIPIQKAESGHVPGLL